MKRIALFLCLSGLFFASSCSNDFDVIADYEETPVVYGLLDQNDSTNYIRIQRLFVDPTTNAIQLAQDPDQLFYDDLSVKIEEFSFTLVTNTIDLYEVDGDDEGLPREPGIFANSPNTLYRFDYLMDNTKSYRIIVVNNETDKQVTGEEVSIGDFTMVSPLKKPDPDLSYLQFTYASQRKYKWEKSNASLFDLSLLIHIQEIKLADPTDITEVDLNWKIGRNIPRGSETFMEYDVRGIRFYEFLANNLEFDPTIKRKITSVDIVITGGGEQLSKYLNVQNANAGITSSETVPTYTNIEGGLGVFSTKNTFIEDGFLLDDTTLDTLRAGPLTNDLGFND